MKAIPIGLNVFLYKAIYLVHQNKLSEHILALVNCTCCAHLEKILY